MADLIYRTEDIPGEEVLSLFVETSQDRAIIDSLKGVTPVVLIGSRGVGKSFLFRVAEEELLASFHTTRILPVYVTFTKSSLLHTSDPQQFQHWMMARLCSRVLKSLRARGFFASPPHSISVVAGGSVDPTSSGKARIEEIADKFEDSWRQPGSHVDITGLPSVEDFKDAIEDICHVAGIKRFSILFDEAAHIFRPEQQRQFFTLFRDLRSPYISCNAAVYPGVTSYGDTFQPAHDATMLTLDRNISSDNYVPLMREMVIKQVEADSDLLESIIKNGQNFAVLAYASSGNPRILLKTITRASAMTSRAINELLREYYRSEIWSEHSLLCDKYPGHTELIDWGRRFIENEVLPDLHKKNIQYLETDKNSTCFFWLHRDAPQPIKEALRLLAYTGIVSEHATGIKATRSEIGTRYAVNLGCLFSLESSPTTMGFKIAKSLTPKRMIEFGMNHSVYQDLLQAVPSFAEPDISEILSRELGKSVDILDISPWQKQTLKEMDLQTIGDVLRATETKLQVAKYVGEKRARRMRSAAIAAVYEYLSG